MTYRIVAGIIGAALLIIYMSPVLWRLRNDVALWVVAGLGTTMMLVDLWQSLRAKEDDLGR